MSNNSNDREHIRRHPDEYDDLPGTSRSFLAVDNRKQLQSRTSEQIQTKGSKRKEKQLGASQISNVRSPNRVPSNPDEDDDQAEPPSRALPDGGNQRIEEEEQLWASEQAKAAKENREDSLDKLDQRTPSERQFFDLIEAGDMVEFSRQFSSHRRRNEVDWAKKDRHGHDMASHAVVHGQLEMLEKILPRIKNGREALLHAIKANRLDMVRVIYAKADPRRRFLMPPDQKNRLRQGEGERIHSQIDNKFDDCEFGDHMTPFLLAAMNGHFEILQYLYKTNRIGDDDYESKRHEKILEFHKPNCDCGSCKKVRRDLERTMRRLDTLKARANPVYLIFLASERGIDPVHESFNLHEEIIYCSRKEMDFDNEYKEIARALHSFPVELLDLCRNSEEVKTFLSAKSDEVAVASPYPRLTVAIDHFHREFVAHPNVQHVVENLFHGEVLNKHNTVGDRLCKYIWTFILATFYPFFQTLYWLSTCCCPKSALATGFLHTPRMKSWCRFVSHLYFCVLLYYMNAEEVSLSRKKPPTKYVGFLVLCYGVPLWLSVFRRFMMSPNGFFKSGWNWWELLTQAVFTVQVGLATYLYIQSEKNTWKLIRVQLPQHHPLLLEECARGIFSAMFTLRLLRWTIFSSNFGPIQTGFYRMAMQQWTYVLLIPAIILAFSCSTDILVRYYESNRVWDSVDLKPYEQFIELNYPKRLMVNFFGGGIGPDEARIFNLPQVDEDGKKLEGGFSQLFVVNQLFITFFAVVWNALIISFFKDTLVGQFSAAGPAIFEAKDTEWKFDRAKEMLYQAMDGSLAPPLNIIPTGTTLCRLCSMLGSKCVYQKKARCICSCDRGIWLEDEESQNRNASNKDMYPKLMKKLCLRWFSAKFDHTQAKPTQEDVQGVQSCVLEIRKLVRHRKRNNYTQNQTPQFHKRDCKCEICKKTKKRSIQSYMEPRDLERSSTYSYLGDSHVPSPKAGPVGSGLSGTSSSSSGPAPDSGTPPWE